MESGSTAVVGMVIPQASSTVRSLRYGNSREGVSETLVFPGKWYDHSFGCGTTAVW